jgi:hypothetical protein
MQLIFDEKEVLKPREHAGTDWEWIALECGVVLTRMVGPYLPV